MNDLPDGWVAASLADLCTTITDGDHQPPPQVNEGIPFLVIGNVKSGSIETEGARRVPEAYYAALDSKRKPTTGDILYTVTGSYGIPVAVRSSAPFCVQRHIAILRPAQGVDQSFLRYALTTGDAFQQATKVATGTAQKTVPLSGLRRFKIKVPPPQEQVRLGKRLDSYISRLDAAIKGLKRVQANLKRYRASVLKAAVEGRLVPTEAELARQEGRDYEPASVLLGRILKERRRRWEESELAKFKAKGSLPKDDKWKAKYKEPAPPDTSDLPELPEGWCWASVDELASDSKRAIQSGPFGSNLLHSEFQDTGVLVLGIDNVQDGYFSMGAQNRIAPVKFQELEKYKAHPGDVLITVMATIGRCCVVPPDLEPAIITKHVYRITPEARLIESEYFHLALWGAPSVREQIFGKSVGQTRPGLNGTILKSLAIPLAPRREQTRILLAVQNGLSHVASVSTSTSNATRRIRILRQAVLAWAFEGKLVDQDPTDEPAEALLARIREERGASPGAGKAPERVSAARKGTGSAPAPKNKKKAASRAKKNAP